MSWNIKSKLKQALKGEEGTVFKDFGGKTSYALIYPNTYNVGMSNLGVHNVYRLLNEQGNVVCERAFLPEKKDLREHERTGTPLMTVESQRPLADFDVVAFSVAYENDMPNIRTILDISSIKKGGRQRLLVGGAVATLNPGLFSEMFDEVIEGDFEEVSRSNGIQPARTVIWTRDTEFGSMHLVEVQRGCPHRCKFCAAPIIYQPFKQFGKEDIIKAIDAGLPHRKKIGLIGGDIFAHPDFVEIAEHIHSRQAAFSPSSVRADRITPKIAELLKISGHRTITLAPEAGSESLRKSIGKNIPDEKFLRAADILAERGIKQLKLYFMIGLPGETEADIGSIAEFIRKIKGPAHGIKVTAAVNPFVPKRRTPFEGEAFTQISDLKLKMALLKKMVAKIGNVTLRTESPLNALREYEWQK